MSSRVSADQTAIAAPMPSASAGRPGSYKVASEGSLRRAWLLRTGLLLSVIVWTTAWYWDTASSMAGIWWRSETFAHGIVVYPISLWLIWRRRVELAGLQCRPSWIGLTFVGLSAFAWLLGDLGGVQAASHLGFVAIIACSVWAVLGTSVARAIAFPLAFTLMAVPVGEFLLPMLIEHTADFTVGALRMTGIPVYREGNDFIVPTGRWSVVEACSGLRYLIASITLGLLYAYLSYRRLSYRVIFVIAAVVVPIVANWLRAYMIVMIGHLSGMKYAVGVDHLLYGWVFFGIVMLMLFWLGARWRDDEPIGKPNLDGQRMGNADLKPALIAGALLSSAAVAAAPMYARSLEVDGRGPDVSIAMPAPANGWRPVSSDDMGFRPHYVAARQSLEQSFEKGGRVVSMNIGYYVNERQGNELISRANSIVSSNDVAWRRVAQARVSDPTSDIQAIQTRVRSKSTELAIWHWYWAGERWVSRPELVKALQALDKLFGKGDDVAVIVLYTQASAESRGAEKVLQEFSTDMGRSIETTLRDSRHARRATEVAMRSAGR